ALNDARTPAEAAAVTLPGKPEPTAAAEAAEKLDSFAQQGGEGSHAHGRGEGLDEGKSNLLAQQLLEGKPEPVVKAAPAPQKKKSVVGRTMEKVARALGIPKDTDIPRAVASLGFRKEDSKDIHGLALPPAAEV